LTTGSSHSEHIITVPERELQEFCGRNDARLSEIERHMKVKMVTRGSMIKVMGETEAVERTAALLEDLLDVFRSGGQLPRQQVSFAIQNASQGAGERADVRAIFKDSIEVPLPGKRVSPMTANQKVYVDAIRDHDIVFGIGPAGTGKTYLAMAMAVTLLHQGAVRRIVLVRPAVEAGERLGFLPGDIAAKFDPFVRPLYDALYDMMDSERAKSYMETGIIELAPLAFMRGRTLNDAMVILDEGQNTTVEQMKMFLTRLGFNSKMVITGDITQVDLAGGRMSGLVHAQRALGGVKGISFVEFDQRDIVRHNLVQGILQAYEEQARHDQGEEPRRGDRDRDRDRDRDGGDHGKPGR